MDPDQPLPLCLQLGADHRSVIHPATGLTNYRTAVTPRASLPFGSCTGNTLSPRAEEGAQQLLERMRGAGPEVAEQVAEEQRRRLQEFALQDSPGQVVLCPSGTDAVFLVSTLAMRRGRPVHHVVVGASELGGGTLSASEGRCFTDTPPFGGAEKGDVIEGIGACTAEPVYLRHLSGQRVALDAVDQEVAECARAAAVSGSTVVLHLVAHSKTGLRSPSLSLALALSEELRDRLIVWVDAAQGRLGPADIARALDAGFVVLFTGSKFYSGPPFSGAVFLPKSLAGDPGALPKGLRSFLDRASMPAHWTEARASLPIDSNLGLALRWEAALAEVDHYHAILPRIRAAVYHTFAGAVFEIFGQSKVVELDNPKAPVHRLVTGLGAFPTVFGFQVRGADGDTLNAADLKVLHRLLDTPLGHLDLAGAGSFHLGQPVDLGPEGPGQAVLRVALSARLVSDFAHEHDAGGPWFRAQLAAIENKLSWLIRSGLWQEL